jgi:hypothetical protein
MNPCKPLFAFPIQIKVQTAHKKYRMHHDMGFIGGRERQRRKPRAPFFVGSFCKQTDDFKYYVLNCWPENTSHFVLFMVEGIIYQFLYPNEKHPPVQYLSTLEIAVFMIWM